MLNHQNNDRVLGRRGARLLTPEETANITGAGTISHKTSGNPLNPTDTHEDSDCAMME